VVFRRTLPLASAVIILLAGCGDTGGNGAYPADAERRFMSACQAGGGDRGHCSCYLIYLEETVSIEDFERSIQGDPQTGSKVSNAVAAATSACP
jgi:hypothetical protein